MPLTAASPSLRKKSAGARRPSHRMQRQLLYISQMTPRADYRHLSQITQQASALNRRDGIRAALLFDGYRFCQHLQGPTDAVGALLQRLQKDPRHSGLRVLADVLAPVDAEVSAEGASQGPGAGAGPGPGADLRPPALLCASPWVSGYCDAQDFDAFEAPSPPQGLAALERFAGILQHADLRP